MRSVENAYKANEYIMVFPEHITAIEVQNTNLGQFTGDFQPESDHTHFLVICSYNGSFIVGSGTREGCLNQKDVLRKMINTSKGQKQPASV